MRDCVFLVADSTIDAVVRGFLKRDGFHQSLGCAAFDFDPVHDLVVDPQRDPGVYTRGHELLRTFVTSHRRAVVILDAAWEGSPGAAAIRNKINADLAAHWSDYLVVVLDPEIEAWIWQDNAHVCEALGAASYAALRDSLEAKGFWSPGETKPHMPKEAVEFALRLARKPRSAALYGQIASKVSTRNCEDQAFGLLKDQLTTWFEATT